MTEFPGADFKFKNEPKGGLEGPPWSYPACPLGFFRVHIVLCLLVCFLGLRF